MVTAQKVIFLEDFSQIKMQGLMGPPPPRKAKGGGASSAAGSAPARGLASMYKDVAVPKDDVSIPILSYFL